MNAEAYETAFYFIPPGHFIKRPVPPLKQLWTEVALRRVTPGSARVHLEVLKHVRRGYPRVANRSPWKALVPEVMVSAAVS